MSYMDAVNGMKAGGPMTPNPATQGLGAPPAMKGLPPPPTGIGAMSTGAPGTTKKTAGADAIDKLRAFQGFAPELFNEINGIIDKIKSAAYDKQGQNPGPAIGDAGPSGAAQQDTSPLDLSGAPPP